MKISKILLALGTTGISTTALSSCVFSDNSKQTFYFIGIDDQSEIIIDAVDTKQVFQIGVLDENAQNIRYDLKLKQYETIVSLTEENKIYTITPKQNGIANIEVTGEFYINNHRIDSLISLKIIVNCYLGE